MRKISAGVIIVCVCAFLSMACLGPANIEGVAFTSSESTDVQKLMKLGIEHVNYEKDSVASNLGIRFKSHYDGRATVFIGTYGMSFQQNIGMKCMGVVFPVSDSANVYSKIDKAVFNFAAAVKAELAWLASRGIVGMTAARIDAIGNALEASGNGGMQYWTHADKVLAYNEWYVKDSLSGVWSTSGVNGVRSLDGVKGCSVIHPGSGLPPESIGTTAILTQRIPSSNRADAPCIIRPLGNGAAMVFLPNRQNPGPGYVTIVNSKGAAIVTKRAPANARSLYINNIAAGYYAARFVYR